MKKQIIVCSLALLEMVFPVHADEGMWLMPELKKNEPAMQALGLTLTAEALYHPDSLALRDAVVIFDNGCTASVISSQGLLLTNHHCGYDGIHQLSTVEHNYIEDGFWAQSFQEELPVAGLTIRYIDRIVEVTDFVNEALKSDTANIPMKALSPKFLRPLAADWAKEHHYEEKPGVSVEIKPFYEGNRYYLFVIRTFSDIRLVGTPPSSIGKFGGDTDNWMWPRHTGDFSLFRIYADTAGNPADYSPENIPFRPRKHVQIALTDRQENDFAMIIGFPGSTNRFYTSKEVAMRRDVENRIRIDARTLLLNALAQEMKKSPEVNLQYLADYSSLANYWKNAIGMNRDIDRLSIIDRRAEEEKSFTDWARENGKTQYADALFQIGLLTEQYAPLRAQTLLLHEALLNGMPFSQINYNGERLLQLLQNKGNKAEIASEIEQLDRARKAFNDGSFSWEVVQEVAPRMLTFYATQTAPELQPAFYRTIAQKYKGSYARFVKEAIKRSIFSNEKAWKRFQKHPTAKALENDPLLRITEDIATTMTNLHQQILPIRQSLSENKKIYMGGILERMGSAPSYPDANFTQRLTYGKICSYDPKDGIHYNYRTTLKGVLEKEDPSDPEFIVPERLKTLYNEENYGRYRDAQQKMTVNFLTDNDITGGNSGSPIFNGRGELIGAAFDGNWEAMSGDILFEPELQRCIGVDIRYILFIIEYFAQTPRLIEELDFAQ